MIWYPRPDEGGFLLARAQHTTEPLLAGHAAAAYIAAMPVTAQASHG